MNSIAKEKSNRNIDQAEPVLDDLSRTFIDAFPELNRVEQRIALNLYALLAEGDAVTLERLARRSSMVLGDAKKILGNWPGIFYDEEKRVIGFWGIAVGEMDHKLEVNNKTVYAWCAWDALFIPELLNTTATVISHCASTGDEITLTVHSDGAKPAQSNEEVVVSFLIPDETALKENVTASFCHYVHFFSSLAAGEQWTADHPDTFLLSLEDAFILGKKVNAARYQQSFDR